MPLTGLTQLPKLTSPGQHAVTILALLYLERKYSSDTALAYYSKLVSLRASGWIQERDLGHFSLTSRFPFSCRILRFLFPLFDYFYLTTWNA